VPTVKVKISQKSSAKRMTKSAVLILALTGS
jgi:hypothetical protein